LYEIYLLKIALKSTVAVVSIKIINDNAVIFNNVVLYQRNYLYHVP